MKQIWTFVITGGPCSGKTTALSIIQKELTDKGYCVLTIPETATELISNGIYPFDDYLSIPNFQNILFEKQLKKEELYQKVAQMLTCDKIVVLCDRGLIDIKSYTSKERFQEILTKFSLNELNVLNRYNAVFHLVTTANGAEKFYNLLNNTARTETAEEAKKLDLLGIQNWSDHPNFHIIDNSTDFNNKIKRVIDNIYSVLNNTRQN